MRLNDLPKLLVMKNVKKNWSCKYRVFLFKQGFVCVVRVVLYRNASLPYSTSIFSELW